MEMCSAIGVNLQRGMNFRLREAESIILMSLRPGAPYADQVQDDGRVLIYEGHDIARTLNGPHPKQMDQPERVSVYEKIRSGIWVYNGLFELVDYWTEQSGGRKVFKFKLQFAGTDDRDRPSVAPVALDDDRLIPSWVKL